MLIKGELVLDDLIALQKNHISTSKKVKKRSRIFTIIAVIVLFILLFLLQPSIDPLNTVFKIILIMLVVVLAPIFQERIIIRKLKRTNYQKQLGPFIIDMHEKGIHFKRQNSLKQIEWQDIQRITKDDDHFFIYRNDNSAIIIPKNAINSEKDFISFLLNHIDSEHLDNNPILKPKRRKTIITSLFLALIIVLGMQFYYSLNANKIAIAIQKVSGLYVEEDENEGKKGESSKIKDSTDQEQINEAMEAVSKIDINRGKQGENRLIVMGLDASVIVAQNQFNKREGTLNSSNNEAQDEQKDAADSDESNKDGSRYVFEGKIDRESDDYQKIVNEIFGIDVYIPKFNTYEIISIESIYSLIMEEEYITIKYSKEKGKLKDENFIKQREKDFNSTILYGIYDDNSIDLKISYHKEDHFTSLDESKTINDINVEYNNTVNSTFKVSFISNKGTYETQFNLNEVSKEEAFEIIDTITNNLNN